MNNRGASIFIIPIFILSMSVISTFTEGSSTLRALFSKSQYANPLIEEVDLGPAEETVRESSDEEAGDVPADEAHSGEEAPADTRDESGASEDSDATEDTSTSDAPAETPADTPVETPAEEVPAETPVETPVETPAEEVPAESSGGGGTSSDTPSETPADTPVETPVETPEVVVEEVVAPTPEELLLARQQLFITSRENLAARFRETLERLDDSRDALTAEIEAKELAGEDTADEREALEDLNEAISDTRSYINDNTLPDTIPILQRALITYVVNIRGAIETSFQALRDAIGANQ